MLVHINFCSWLMSALLLSCITFIHSSSHFMLPSLSLRPSVPTWLHRQVPLMQV